MWMDLKNHPSSPSPLHPPNGMVVQWHGAQPPGCVSSVILRMVSWKFARAKSKERACFCPGKDWTHRKSPEKLENQCLIIALKWGRSGICWFPWDLSISISEGREDAPGWWKTLFRLSNLWLQKMSGVKNICRYVNSHFDGYTQVITWNPGINVKLLGWKARALFLSSQLSSLDMFF